MPPSKWARVESIVTFSSNNSPYYWIKNIPPWLA
jgi:hypothetical protein